MLSRLISALDSVTLDNDKPHAEAGASNGPSSKRRRVGRKGSKLPDTKRVELAIASGTLTHGEVACALEAAATPERLATLRWSDVSDIVVQLCQLLGLQRNRVWVSAIACGVKDRLAASPLSDSPGVATVRQLSTLIWALGGKGGYAVADPVWAAFMAGVWYDAVKQSVVSYAV